MRTQNVFGRRKTPPQQCLQYSKSHATTGSFSPVLSRFSFTRLLLSSLRLSGSPFPACRTLLPPPPCKTGSIRNFRTGSGTLSPLFPLRRIPVEPCRPCPPTETRQHPVPIPFFFLDSVHEKRFFVQNFLFCTATNQKRKKFLYTFASCPRTPPRLPAHGRPGLACQQIRSAPYPGQRTHPGLSISAPLPDPAGTGQRPYQKGRSPLPA